MNESLQPKNWPEKHHYSPESIGKETHIVLLRLALLSEDSDSILPCIEEKRAHPDLVIRKIDSQLSYCGATPHPLAGLKDTKGREHYGLFAARSIPKGSALGEFVGEVTLLSRADAERQQKLAYNFIIPLENQSFWCIDSDTIANEMMYVNDYRGLKDEPNTHLTRMAHRGIFYFVYATLREIEPNEEILVYYGEGVKL
jgi:hypothetical protein